MSGTDRQVTDVKQAGKSNEIFLQAPLRSALGVGHQSLVIGHWKCLLMTDDPRQRVGGMATFEIPENGGVPAQFSLSISVTCLTN